MALTDQAITRIKDLIVEGEFAPGDRLPREKELAERLGLSRNSLREAVRALTLVGVLEPRQRRRNVRDEPRARAPPRRDVVRQRSSHRADAARALRGQAHPRACRHALRDSAPRGRGFETLERSLEQMDTADTTQAFIDADVDFHRVIVNACGNATLASLIQNLSGGTVRAASGARSTSAMPSRARGGCITTSTTRCASATPARRRDRTSCTWPRGSGGCSR